MNFGFLFLLLLSCIKQSNVLDTVKDSYIELASLQASCAGGLVLIDEKKYLITAAHCYDSEIFLFKDGEIFENEKKLHYMNSVNDVLIYDISGEVKIIPETKIEKLKISDKISYMCGPIGLPPVYIEGMISRSEDDYYIAQAYAWSGCSGSLVYSRSGNLVGVISGIFQVDENNIHENLVMISKIKKSFLGE